MECWRQLIKTRIYKIQKLLKSTKNGLYQNCKYLNYFQNWLWRKSQGFPFERTYEQECGSYLSWTLLQHNLVIFTFKNDNSGNELLGVRVCYLTVEFNLAQSDRTFFTALLKPYGRNFVNFYINFFGRISISFFSSVVYKAFSFRFS